MSVNMTNEELKDFLEKEYTKNKKTWQECAIMLGTYANKLRRLAAKLGIKSRSKSEAQQLNLSSGKTQHPTKGKKREDDVKRKIAKTAIKNWENLTDEQLEAIKETRRQSWKKLSTEDKKKLHASAMAALRATSKEGSRLEKFLKTKLEADGFTVDYHKARFVANRELELDIFLPKENVAIEIDGPSHYYPIFSDKQLAKQIKADQEKEGYLRQGMIKLIRVKYLTKTTSITRMDNVYEAVKEALKSNKEFIEIEVSKCN